MGDGKGNWKNEWSEESLNLSWEEGAEGRECWGVKSDEGINPDWQWLCLLGCNKLEGKWEDGENEGM